MPGRRVGKFELLDELGQGGMGVVYRARDVRLDRLVALKFMRPDRALDASNRARFLRECRAIAALNHGNIATLYEADESDDGTLYFAAELVEGETLARVLSRGPVPLPRGLAIAIEIAEALAAAHAKGIVHRDIKPANIMIAPDSRVKVLDFGLASLATPAEPAQPDSPTYTSPLDSRALGSVVGTPGYMAPEQLRGEVAGPAADIFAAGVVLQELLTPKAHGRVPASVSAVIARCLRQNPGERFRDGAELHHALARCRPSRARLHWWLAGAAVAVVAAWLWFGRSAPLSFKSEDRILIADVTNETTETVFSGALGTALEVDLRQSQYALVVSRREINEALRLSRRPADTRLDLATALDLARWVEAKAVLAPSITQVGSTFRLAATLYATDTGSPVDSVDVIAASKDAVLRTAVDDLTAGVRTRLGESLSQIRQTDFPAVVVTTGSWEALEAVRQGSLAVDRGRAAEAASFFEEAIKRDPEFAAAKGQLGLVLIQFLKQPDRGKKLLAEAAAAPERLSNYERVMLKGLVTQFVDGNFEAALQEFRVATTLFPSRSEPPRNAGMILRGLGRYDEAAVAFNESHTRDPKAVQPLQLLWFLQAGPTRDPAGALASAEKVVALRPDDPDAAHMVGWSYVAQQRFADAEKQLEAVRLKYPTYVRAQTNLAHLALRQGNTPQAVERYRALVDDSRAKRIEQDLEPTVGWLAIALHASDRTAEADPLLVETLQMTKTPAPRALYEAIRGRRAAALDHLRALPDRSKLDADTAITAAGAHAFLGDRDRAIEFFAHALALNPWDRYYNLVRPELKPLWDDERFTRLVTTGK